jgi:hypothetical protein
VLLLTGLAMEAVRAACGASFCTLTTTPEALSERPGQVRFDLSYEYIEQDSPYSGSDESDGVQIAAFPDGDIETVHRELATVSQRVSLRSSLGVSDRLTLDFLVPFIHREHDHFEFEDDAALPGSFDFSSIGDVTIQGRYSLLAPVNPTSPTLAIGAGVKLPTGATDETGVVVEEDGEIAVKAAERSIQPGSGSWDPMVGVYYLQRFGSVTGFANATIRLPSADQGYEFGNETLLNLGGSLPLSARVEALAQVNMRFVGRDDSAEEFELFDQNTGGDSIFLSPGLRLTLGRNLAAYTFVQIPLYRDVNGNQLTADWSLALGFNYSFAAWR